MIGQIAAGVLVLLLAAVGFVVAHRLAVYRDEDRGRVRKRKPAHRAGRRRDPCNERFVTIPRDPAPTTDVDEFAGGR